MGSGAGKLVTWAIIFAFCLGLAGPTHLVAVELSEKSPDIQVNLSQLARASVHPIEITEEHFVPPIDWEFIEGAVLRDIAPLIELLDKELARQRIRYGSDLVDHLQKQERKWALGNSRGEFTLIDAKPILRIVHSETKLSLLILGEDINEKSDHLKQVIARQHIDSGDADPLGKKPGRDTVLVWRSGRTIQRTQYHPRSIPGTTDWWGDYWRATFKKPEFGDYALATYCTAVQIAASGCIGMGKVWLNNGQFEMAPLLLSGLFAAAIGVFSTTYRNWTYRGSDISKIAKMAAVSFLYAYSLALVRDGAATVFSISDPEGLLLHTNILWNTALNQKGRLAWQRLGELRDKLRLSAGHYDLAPWVERAAPGLKHWVRNEDGKSIALVSRATFFNQNLYLIPFSFKLVGLVGLTSVTLPYAGWNLETGPLLLMASIPAALLAVAQFAKQMRRHLGRQIEEKRLAVTTATETERAELKEMIHEKEYAESVVMGIEKELNAEQKSLWTDLIRPLRFFKKVGLFFSNSTSEIYSTWAPMARNTTHHFYRSCAEWLSRETPAN